MRARASQDRRPAIGELGPPWRREPARSAEAQSARGGREHEGVNGFVAWYHGTHLRSAIRFVTTPNGRHEGRDVAILAARKGVYAKARMRLRETGHPSLPCA